MFQPRPEDFSKQRLSVDAPPPPDDDRSHSWHTVTDDDGAEDRVHRRALAEPRTIDVPGEESASWIARFRGETREHEFGREPSTRLVDEWELLIAWLPIEDPDVAEETPRPPETEWLDLVRGELEVRRSFDVTSLVEVLSLATQRGGSYQDGYFVLCGSGSAPRYMLTPMSIFQPITNGRDVCDRVIELARDRLGGG